MHKTQCLLRAESYGNIMMEVPEFFINNMTLSKNWQIDTKHQYCSFHIRNGRYANNGKSNSRVFHFTNSNTHVTGKRKDRRSENENRFLNKSIHTKLIISK